MENKTTEDSLRRQLRECQKRERHDAMARAIFSGAIGGAALGVGFGSDWIGALVGGLLCWFGESRRQKAQAAAEQSPVRGGDGGGLSGS